MRERFEADLDYLQIPNSTALGHNISLIGEKYVEGHGLQLWKHCGFSENASHVETWPSPQDQQLGRKLGMTLRQALESNGD